jgi:DNA-binding SARP family transcriptional activator
VVLSKDELAFSFTEFSEAVRQRIDRAVDDAELERSWRETAGWCVAVGLLADTLAADRQAKPTELAAATKSARALADYMREELLQDLPVDLSDFLARCSLLEEISAETALAVMDDSERIERNLRALRDSAIPHVALHDRKSFRLHPLVREAFKRLLRDACNPEELQALYRSAADYQRQQGAVIEAVELLLQLPDHGAALQAIDEEWHKIVEANGLGTAQQWLDQCPRDLSNTPRFIKIQAQAYSVLGQNRRLVEYLAERLDPDLYRDDYATLGNLWIHYHWARLHLSAEMDYRTVRQDWESLKRRCGPFRDSIEAGVHLTLSLAAYQELRLDKATEHAEACLSLIDENQFSYVITVRNNLAMYRHLRGQAATALEGFETILAACHNRDAYAVVPMILINIAEIHVSQARYRLALEAIHEAHDVMDRHRIHNAGVLTYADRLKGISLWHLGEHAEALRLLACARDCAGEYDEREKQSTEQYIEFFRSLTDGGRQPQRRVSLRASKLNEHTLLRLAVDATLAVRQEQWPRLQASASALANLVRSAPAPQWRATAAFLLAHHAAGTGDPKECKRHLRRGLSTLERIGWTSHPMACDAVTGFVIVKAVRYGLCPHTVQRLLETDYRPDLTDAVHGELEDAGLTAAERVRLLSAATDYRWRGLGPAASRLVNHEDRETARAARDYLAMAAATPLPPLRARTLGGFSVVADGRPVVFKRKKSRRLLQILMVDSLKPVHEEVIIEALWPESDPAKGKTSLQTCVKDLRRSLDPHHDPKGSSYVVYADHHYRLALPEDSAVDVLEFQDAVRNILAAGSRDPSLTEAQEGELKRALDLFGGEFLPEERYEPYAVEMRERLNQEFLRASEWLAQHLIAAGRSNEAVGVLERGLAVDPFWGEGVELLMQAHAEGDELFRALQVYRKYEQRLQADLGVAPDDSLKARFETLMSSSSS